MAVCRDDDHRNVTALMMATIKGNCDVLSLLLSHKADVNACDSDMYTALHFAAYYDKADCGSLLLSHGAHVDARIQCTGPTALILAAEDGNCDFLSSLLLHKADINASDNDKYVGLTALHFAARTGKIDAVSMLLLQTPVTTAAIHH